MKNFIVEWIVALVLVYLMATKWPVPLIRAGMENTQEKIRASLEAADKAAADAAAVDDERHRKLEEARQSAQDILAQAQRTAEAVRTGAQARGQSDYERIVGSAEVEVALARQRAVEEAANLLGQVVMDLVENVISREVSAEAHHDLIEEAVSALRADAAGGAAASSGARS
ncbi:MAG TPA: F0F1 ATP synthase subunit B [Acidimicrobiales bacterium]